MSLITNINNEDQYHSFLIVQTENKQIAEKWDYYVLSCSGYLSMNAEQNKSENKYEYNLSADTVSYAMKNSKGKIKLILAEGNWIKPCLTKTQLALLNATKVLQYKTLSLSKYIRFYYYMKNKFNSETAYMKQKQQQKQVISSQNKKEQFSKSALYYDNFHKGHFVQIKLKYVLRNDCLIFELNTQIQNENNIKILQMQNFKQIGGNQTQPVNNLWKFNIYNFKSQYALLSDEHFLNCLVKGKKLIGSYLKLGSSYQFMIDQQIASVLNAIYVQPKL